MYIDKSVREYIDLTSERVSAPGGGSVLALVSSLGNGLSEMAMKFSLDKDIFLNLDLEVRNNIERSLKMVELYRKKTMELVDLDTAAFNKVLLGYKMEKGTDERARTIEEGYKEALEIPLLCFRYSLESLKLQYLLSSYVDKGIITDIIIGSMLSFAAMEGSIYNIKINLNGIKDLDYKEKIISEVDLSLIEGRRFRDLIKLEVDKKLL